MTAILYALTVLIWGMTWITIKNELGHVSVEASIVYRFALAGVVLFAALLLTQRLRPIPLRHQPFVLLQTLCLRSGRSRYIQRRVKSLFRNTFCPRNDTQRELKPSCFSGLDKALWRWVR